MYLLLYNITQVSGSNPLISKTLIFDSIIADSRSRQNFINFGNYAFVHGVSNSDVAGR